MTLCCLERSTEDDILFIGCGRKNRSSKGSAIIIALSFTEKLRIINEARLPLSGAGSIAVSFIKKALHNDVLITGVFRSIIIIEWNGEEFIQLQIIEAIHSCRIMIIIGFITGIDATFAKVFCVCEKDDYITEIDFDYN